MIINSPSLGPLMFDPESLIPHALHSHCFFSLSKGRLVSLNSMFSFDEVIRFDLIAEHGCLRWRWRWTKGGRCSLGFPSFFASCFAFGSFILEMGYMGTPASYLNLDSVYGMVYMGTERT